ncbi:MULTISPECIES: TetR/AcrR family transcriptional regulator [unclassified Amycolatopsis]|uniref:TetR/AcrR family transcriptional regulator n=1 Tax=unclassified Amycolatopsis TaxID=2618356 RepID=UPI0028750283|nr:MULTISPECIES: TetR/AcrR family transcriptional regulator [unclassified Amycolatopsis]MDS0135183.1 TetR/AcrR family transcriptional regulator [Amycolatopsis sp. 505]MDS0143040.1 TetR/AcrR family transcriptional regulator [Amycolatopsis sp. CM201R]
MGNKESLLAGAKRCLYEKGYARTTVRDLASAANVSMAAIGYHFGSREALLNAALIEANQEWGETLAKTLQVETPPGASPAERFALIWQRVIESFGEHRRMWAVSFEAYSQPELDENVRAQLADALEQARHGLANLFQGLDDESAEARAAGTVHQALLSGVMLQWLIDPGHAPSGADLVSGLRLIAKDVLT